MKMIHLNVAVAFFALAYASKPLYDENIETRQDISQHQVSGLPSLMPICSNPISRQGKKRQEEVVLSKNVLNKRTLGDTDKDAVKNTEQAKITEENFNNFIEDLKAFIDKEKFDFERFQTDLDHLQVTYDAIDSHIPAAPSESLLAQQRYVHEVFETIKQDSALARTFGNPKNKFHLLATQMLSLNLSLISLRDSHGMPNTEMKGFKDRVFYFQNILRLRETNFSDLMYYREFLKYEDLAMPAREVYTQSHDSIKKSLDEFISKFSKHEFLGEKSDVSKII
ncbi:hypothetical protein OXX79_002969 [Metschnikowia pulcherrima]